MRFNDRHDAGKRLAAALERFRPEHPVVLGLPRGGVIVAYRVALALDAPLDVLVVRKIGAPGHEELAIGALAPGAMVLDRDAIARLGIPPSYIEHEVACEEREMLRREAAYRPDQPPLDVTGRTVLLVDDGLATGATARAAVLALRQHHPKRVIFAAPVCSTEGAAALRRVADEVVCLECPRHFRAVGDWYDDFLPTTDDQVVDALRLISGKKVEV